MVYRERCETLSVFFMTIKQAVFSIACTKEGECFAAQIDNFNYIRVSITKQNEKDMSFSRARYDLTTGNTPGIKTKPLSSFLPCVHPCS